MTLLEDEGFNDNFDISVSSIYEELDSINDIKNKTIIIIIIKKGGEGGVI